MASEGLNSRVAFLSQRERCLRHIWMRERRSNGRFSVDKEGQSYSRINYLSPLLLLRLLLLPFSSDHIRARTIFFRRTCDAFVFAPLRTSDKGVQKRMKRRKKRRRRSRKREKEKRGWHPSAGLVLGVPAKVCSAETHARPTSDVQSPMYIIYEVSAFLAMINQAATLLGTASIWGARRPSRKALARFARNSYEFRSTWNYSLEKDYTWLKIQLYCCFSNASNLLDLTHFSNVKWSSTVRNGR